MKLASYHCSTPQLKRTGFEPVTDDANRFTVYLLNRSDTSSRENEIRTHDFLLPKQTLLLAELFPV